MPARPLSVTVVAWILIVFGAFGLLGVLSVALLWDSPTLQQSFARIYAPLALQVTVGLAGVAIRLGCGIVLLFRQNWARFLYAVWLVINLGYGVVSSPYTPWLLVPSLLLTLVIVYVLFRPAASRYLAGGGGLQPPVWLEETRAAVRTPQRLARDHHRCGCLSRDRLFVT